MLCLSSVVTLLGTVQSESLTNIQAVMRKLYRRNVQLGKEIKLLVYIKYIFT